MRFLALEMYDSVPDSTTAWRFREWLKELGLVKPLFRSLRRLLAKGRVGCAQQADRRCRNRSRADPAQQPRSRRIKAGEEIEEWGEHKGRQKDSDARWTKKHGKSYFGYKNHIDADAEHKLIRD
jgi:transposase, IS5 family